MAWSRDVVLTLAAASATSVLAAACARQPAPTPKAAEPKPPRIERLLPGSENDWEPALAVGPGGKVYVTAGRQKGTPRDKGFSQQIVIWRSDDGGASWKGPSVVSDKSAMQGDQRVAVGADGTVLVSYIALGGTPEKPLGLLELARSTDGGETFTVTTVTDELVSDKPELAVSADGRDVYLFYESRPGPRLIASYDHGRTWGKGQVVVPSEGRHFWPTGLAVAPDGVLWAAVPSVSNADIQKGQTTDSSLHVFRSADVGASWQEFDFGKSSRVLNGCAHFPDCFVKVNSIGLAVDAKGRAYVAYTEGEAKKPYRLFFKSTEDGGKTWSAPVRLSEAKRPASQDEADADFTHVAAGGDGRVCVTWVDDRTGDRNFWARCSADAGRTFGAETLLSNRTDGASYKSPAGFKVFHGDYGGVALTPESGLVAAWGEGLGRAGTGAVWFNAFDPAAGAAQPGPGAGEPR